MNYKIVRILLNIEEKIVDILIDQIMDCKSIILEILATL